MSFLICYMREEWPDFLTTDDWGMGPVWTGNHESKVLKTFDDDTELYETMEELIDAGFTPLSICRVSEVPQIIKKAEQREEYFNLLRRFEVSL